MTGPIEIGAAATAMREPAMSKPPESSTTGVGGFSDWKRILAALVSDSGSFDRPPQTAGSATDEGEIVPAEMSMALSPEASAPSVGEAAFFNAGSKENIRGEVLETGNQGTLNPNPRPKRSTDRLLPQLAQPVSATTVVEAKGHARRMEIRGFGGATKRVATGQFNRPEVPDPTQSAVLISNSSLELPKANLAADRVGASPELPKANLLADRVETSLELPEANFTADRVGNSLELHKANLIADRVGASAGLSKANQTADRVEISKANSAHADAGAAGRLPSGGEPIRPSNTEPVAGLQPARILDLNHEATSQQESVEVQTGGTGLNPAYAEVQPVHDLRGVENSDPSGRIEEVGAIKAVQPQLQAGLQTGTDKPSTIVVRPAGGNEGDDASAPAGTAPPVRQPKGDSASIGHRGPAIGGSTRPGTSIHPLYSSVQEGHAGRTSEAQSATVFLNTSTQTLAVDQPDMRGHASGARSGDAGKSDAFAMLDTGSSSARPIWSHTGTAHAEAGYKDPALGWVGVRANVEGGGIHASLVPSSAGAADALSGQMAGLNAHLAEQHSQVQTLTVAAPEGHALQAGTDQGQNGNARQGNEQGSQAGERPEADRSNAPTDSIRPAEIRPSIAMPETYQFSRNSAHSRISVIA